MLNASDPQDIASIEKCRNIISEILKFGVSEFEMTKLIELLSFELENTSLMREIQKSIKNKDNIVNKVEKEPIIIQ
jgi:hypothetical protein